MNVSISHNDRNMVVTLTGRLDAASAPGVLETLNAQIDGGQSRLVLDFSSMDYISSSGLRMLLVIMKRLSAAGGRMFLCGVNEHVREVFDLAGFTPFFPMYADQKAALEALT